MKKIRFREIKQKEYEVLCEGREIPLTQHYFYGEWQVGQGRGVFRYVVEDGDEILAFFQIIKYTMTFNKSYLYIPHGPIFIKEASSEVISEFRNFCKALLKKENSVFLRFDPTARLNLIEGPTLQWGSLKAPGLLYDGNFQPKYEWVIDLSASEEDILANMKKVNRYTVRQAEKLGVTVDVIDKDFSKYRDKFYELVEETAERDGFSHSPKEYYSKIFDRCEKDRNGFMTIAYFKDEIMLINFFVIYGNSVFFLSSGSENENRKLGYTYLAQWTAIKYAKKLGLKYYNFGAVILEDNRYPFYKNWRGFSDFKKRFGGTLVEYSDFYDVVNNKFWYGLYALRKIIVLLKRQLLGRFF